MSTQRACRRPLSTIAAVVLLTCITALSGCGSDDARESDPVLASLKADPMGIWEPDGFTLADSSSTAREESGAATGKPTQAAWTRNFESSAEAPDSTAALTNLAAAAEREGWIVDYAGPTDVSATKTVDGEPAVLYVAIEPTSTEALPGSERYTLQMSLRS